VLVFLKLSVSILLALSAGFAAYMAWRTIYALKWRANYDFHAAAWNVLASKHKILELHGIDLAELERDGLSCEELIYTCLNFDAGDALYEIGGHKRVKLTPFRKHFLSNPKVRMMWKKYLRDRFFNPTPYAAAINAYIDRLENPNKY
jgi:hypothetical protein